MDTGLTDFCKCGKRGLYEYLDRLLCGECYPKLIALIAEKFDGIDRENRNNLLLHNWQEAELLGKEK